MCGPTRSVFGPTMCGPTRSVCGPTMCGPTRSVCGSTKILFSLNMDLTNLEKYIPTKFDKIDQ